MPLTASETNSRAARVTGPSSSSGKRPATGTYRDNIVHQRSKRNAGTMIYRGHRRGGALRFPM